MMGYPIVFAGLLLLGYFRPECLWLLLPLIAANQHGYANQWGLWKGAEPTYKPLFGPNKTIGAWYMGAILATLVLFFEWCFAPWISMGFGILEWWHVPLHGMLIGVAVVAADHLKSAVKHSRWVDIPAGERWFVDRIDWAVGGVLMERLILADVSWSMVIIVVAAAWPVHYFGNRNSKRFGWREKAD